MEDHPRFGMATLKHYENGEWVSVMSFYNDEALDLIHAIDDGCML